MLDTDTRELVEKTLEHDGKQVREFYSTLLHQQVLVGIEATGSMHCFLKLMEELGIEYRVGHPQKIRKAETRKQRHDRRDERWPVGVLVMLFRTSVLSRMEFPQNLAIREDFI